MTDHMEAAIDAARDEIWPKLTFDKVRAGLAATEALAAAEPHLRKKWAEEIREIATPSTENNTTPAHWMTVAGMAEMKARMISFLEGAGE